MHASFALKTNAFSILFIEFRQEDFKIIDNDRDYKLFGNEILAKKELKKIPDFKNYEIIHTDEYIKSDDEPVNALRKLQKSDQNSLQLVGLLMLDLLKIFLHV